MLSAEQLADFDRDGYLVVADVLGVETVLDPIRREYADLLETLCDDWRRIGALGPATRRLDFEGQLLAAYAAGCDWFQPMDISLPGGGIEADTPMHFGPAVFDMITDHGLLDVVESLIGPEITSNPIQHVRLKPPAPALRCDEARAHVGGTDWHQDRGVALAEADATRMVTVWCAISDATEENGCLVAIPGGHLAGLHPHCPQRQLALAPGAIDPTDARPLPVRSGGVVLLHPLTPHASLPNLSARFRWSFDLRYNRTGDPTGRAQFPDFVVRSRADPSLELRAWTEARALWEAARARLADAPHIDIHRWDAAAPVCA